MTVNSASAGPAGRPAATTSTWRPSRRSVTSTIRSPPSGSRRPPGVLDRVAGDAVTPDEAERRRRLDRGGQPASGLDGGACHVHRGRPAASAAAASPPRRARQRPRRPEAEPATALTSAARSGARSASVDQRRQLESSTPSRRRAAPITVARSFSAGRVRVQPAPTGESSTPARSTTAPRPACRGYCRSLSLVPLVRPSHSTSRSSSSSSSLAPRSRMSTVTTRHRSGLKRASLTRSMPWHDVHARFSSASASASREERGDFARHVGARERLGGRAEPRAPASRAGWRAPAPAAARSGRDAWL